jgi:integrase
MMWAQEHYALQTPKGRHSQSQDRVLFQTARGVRSAGSQFYAWDRQIAFPDRALRDFNRRVILTDGVNPSDEMGYTLMSKGMAKRMGDQNKPPYALTMAQVLWVIRRLEAMWLVCTTDVGRREIAAAAAAHLLAWLGWLRSQELFSLTWEDATITRPTDGPRIGLASGVGAIELRLLPETKSECTKIADVIIAYMSASGLVLGLWLERLRSLWPDAPGTARILRGSSGKPWTSLYFRTHHLYVWLYQMRSEGDPFLQAFTMTPGNRIEDKYYSMGSYRRGGRSACTKRLNGTLKATDIEVYEHGRWAVKISKENMPTRYNELALADRLNLTLLCM